MTRGVDHHTRILSLCTGIGGLDLGVELADPAARVVCMVEREAFCLAYLGKAMQEGHMAPCPVWDDVRTFDGGPWRGVVDLITGGYPCQPFSFAGSRLGESDERHIWPDIKRIISEVEPQRCYFENVSGHLSLGLNAVVSDLRDLGYTVPTPLLLQAADVGASHGRERVFIMADRSGGGRGEVQQSATGGRQDTAGRGEEVADREGGNGGLLLHERRPQQTSAQSGGCCETVANSRGERPQGDGARGAAARTVGRGGGTEVGDTEGIDGRGRPYSPSDREEPQVSDGTLADARDIPGQVPQAGRTNRTSRATSSGAGRATSSGAGRAFPPGPDELKEWRQVLDLDLDPTLEPALCRVAHGSTAQSDRVDRLRALGNGVVPLQAAYAYRVLEARLAECW